MAEIYVSNGAELLSALGKAKGGETIVLKNGEYGTLDLSGKAYASTVTIKAATSLAADFDAISLTNCKNISFSGIHVDSPSNTAGALFEVSGCSNITLANAEVNGKVDSVYPIGGPTHGIYVNDASTGVKILNTNVHDILNGITSFGVSNLTLSGNTVDRIGADAFKFSGVKGALIENNTGPQYIYPAADTHSDFMQFQGGASSNIVIRGNVFLPQNRFDTQGIFVAGNGGHSGITIEQNIIYTEMANGIYVADGSTGVKITSNTLINALDDDGTTRIFASGATVTNNIYSMKSGGVDGSNLQMQHSSGSGAYHYTDLFQGLDGSSGGITLADLKPVSGSLAETMGAATRLKQLLGSTTTTPPPPDPTPDPTPDPVPNDDDAGLVLPSDVVFARLGDIEITAAKDVVEVAPTSALQLSAGTIALTFNADTVSGTRGILSKDAYAYVGGGNHFKTYIKDGTLYVRFEDGDSAKTFKVTGIKANTDYDLQASFGNGSVSVWLNDKLVGTGAFSTSWATNKEYLQIGADGGNSATGKAGFTSVFDGTISDVVIVKGVKTPAQMDSLLAGATTATTTAKVAAPATMAMPLSESATAATEDDEPAPVYQLSGDRSFAGREADIVSVAHKSAFETTEGTIVFSFEADTVAGRQGLVSKDAAGYQGGGNHFSVWLQNGSLHVRAQDEDSDAKFIVRGIKADREYDVQAVFDEDSIALYLDGAKVGEKAFSMDWTANKEVLQIGGLGWKNATGTDDAAYAFDGTISDLRIYDEALAPQDHDFFA